MKDPESTTDTLKRQRLAHFALTSGVMSDVQKRQRKKKAIISAGSGFILLLLAVLPIIIFGEVGMTLDSWIIALVITVVIWMLSYIAIEFRGDERVKDFDPHFVFIPAFAASINIAAFVYLAPELRILVLGGWFTVILFGGGLLKRSQLLLLSFIMGVLYALVIVALYLEGHPMNLTAELSQLIPFWVFWVYSGRVTDRIRERREENRILRNELTQLAFSDPLTGVDNRRAFESKLERRLETLETGEAIAIIVFDLDHFKTINDERGHLAGDHVLMQTAKNLQSIVPHPLTFARLGGDEFATVIDITSPEALNETLNKIWAQFSAKTLGQYTTSAGAVFCDQQTSSSRCMRIADTALYDAKASGRNCYRIINLRDLQKAMSKREKH
jgi:diguanylate cyclase (GGDEF)-like protein